RIGTGDIEIAQRALGAGVVDQRKRTVADGLGSLEGRRQSVEIVDLALRELRQHLESSEALQLPPEVVAEIAEQLLGVAAGLLGERASFLRHALGAMRTLAAEVSQHRRTDRRNCQHRARGRDLPRPQRRAPRRELPGALLREQPLGGLAGLALLALVAAALDDRAQHVVRELDAAQVEPLLDAQQPPVDEHRERAGRSSRLGETAEQALLRDALT